MAHYKMVVVAALGVAGWLGVSAVCFSSIAKVPAHIATIENKGAPTLPAVPTEPPLSVAAAK